MNDDTTRENRGPEFVFEAVTGPDGRETTGRSCCGGGRCGHDDPDV
ncbi:hypothetical protein ABT352_10105 [Streptosporangium sp. NPDC000563]